MTTFIIQEAPPILYIDGQLVEYKECALEVPYITDFLASRLPPKWRIVLATGQVINVATEKLKITHVDGKPLRIDLEIG